MTHYLTLTLVKDRYPDELLQPYGDPSGECLRCLSDEVTEVTQTEMDYDPEPSDTDNAKRQLFYPCPNLGKPTSGCCGTVCTCKPEVLWDSWIPGGRHKGYLDEVLSASDKPSCLTKDGDKPVCVPVKDLPSPFPERYLPLAVVAPDGEWYERREDGDEARAVWAEKVRELLAQNMDAIAVVCDMHI